MGLKGSLLILKHFLTEWQIPNPAAGFGKGIGP